MPNFIEIARTAVEISQLLDFSKWRLPLSWILTFLMVRHAKKVEPLHCAKFRLNRPGRHVVNLSFLLFKMAAAANFDFGNSSFLTIGTAKKVELCHRAKFRRNRSKCG